MKVLAFATQKLKLHSWVNPSSSVQAVNFWHLYWDIAWFGIAFGSTMSFLPVFATRLGATGWQVGLLNALPALVSVLFTLYAGRWVEARPLKGVLKQTIILQRLGFVLLIPLPCLLPASWQISMVLLLTLLMAIPGTALVIGFNAMLAATVPPEFRGRVVGGRNALLAGTIMLSFLLSGAILDRLSFEWGYFVLFSLGALGAVMSAYHVICIQVPEPPPEFEGRSLRDHAQPARLVALTGTVPQRLTMGLRLLLNWRPSANSLGRVSRGFWWAMFAFFLFHFAQLLPTPLYPLFWVREVQLTDGQIAWVNALFFLTMLMASPFLGALTKRWGNYHLIVWGAVLLALYPLLTAFSKDMTLLIVAATTGGAIWAILSGALYNRLLEIVPANDRPVYLAVYNLALNIAMLSATMLGPLLVDVFGLRETLLVVTLLRMGSGLALARWG